MKSSWPVSESCSFNVSALTRTPIDETRLGAPASCLLAFRFEDSQKDRISKRRVIVYSLRMNSFEDKIWFDGERRLNAICEDALDAAAHRSNALILAHFKTTLTKVEDRLAERSIEYKSYSPLDFSSLCPRAFAAESPSIWVGLASHFQARSLPPAEHSASSLCILVAEHQPMAPKDQALLRCRWLFVLQGASDLSYLAERRVDDAFRR
jgi:hypothetical protein